MRVSTLAQIQAVATGALQSRFYIHQGRVQYKFGRARNYLGRAARRDLIQNSLPLLERSKSTGTLRSKRCARAGIPTLAQILVVTNVDEYAPRI